MYTMAVIPCPALLLATLTLFLLRPTTAFVLTTSPRATTTTTTSLPTGSSSWSWTTTTTLALSRDPDDDEEETGARSSRRTLLRRVGRWSTASSLVVASSSWSPLLFVGHADALVKGNAPPPKRSAGAGGGATKAVTCVNVEECQEQAYRDADKEYQQQAVQAAASPVSIAPRGTRYRDLVVPGSSDVTPTTDTGGDVTTTTTPPVVVTAQTGDTVTVFYKVLKLGKRSYDGLSGEGTVVFSRGYGLEDGETGPGTPATARRDGLTLTVGAGTVIAALNDALPGLPLYGTRRISVAPQAGWERPGTDCDGGPGGRGAGGDLKKDYVVVPTATMVATESCLDKTKTPFPTTYAQQRRMAQRFDQSLIIEVELMAVH